ncbi:MAG: WD40 repeat domain-containing protein [Chloroflexi bacterium]|nr:WD40 repeat domain-containing protein [Chloroflexota bacterium]
MNKWLVMLLGLLIALPTAQGQFTPQLVHQQIIGTGRFTTPATVVDDRVMVGTQSGIAVYDLAGKHLTSFHTTSEVTAFAGQRDLIVSGGRDGRLHLWHDQNQLHTEQPSTNAVKQIVFLSSGIIATTFQNEAQVTIWLIRDNRLLPIRTIDTGPRVVIAEQGILTAAGNELTFCDWTFEACHMASPGFALVDLIPTRVAISEQAIVVEKWLWKGDTITQYLEIEPFSLAFLNAEEILVFPRQHAISGQTEFFSLNINTGAASSSLSTARPFKNITAISPDMFILQSHDTLEIWQNNTLTQTIPASIYESDYLSIAGNWIAGGRLTPFLVNIESGFNAANFVGTTHQLTLSPDGTTLLRIPFANQTGVEVWSLEPLQFRTTLWHQGDIGALAFSDNGQRMATYTNAIRLWDMSTLGTLNVISTGFTVGDALALNANGTLLAAGAIDGDYRIQVWEGVLPLTTLQGHQAPITKIIFAGEYLVSADESGEIKVWDISHNRVEFDLTVENFIDIDTNENWSIIVREDNKMSLWDLQNLTEIVTINEVHPGQISAVELDNDRIFIASDSVGVIAIWGIEE